MLHFALALALALPADVVFENAVVIDGSAPIRSAVAVRGDRILAVGTAEECRAAAEPDAEIVDCGGRPLLRGFCDAHCHLMAGGLAQTECDLRGCHSLVEMQDRVRRWNSKLETDKWLIGRGFDQSLFAGQRWPDRSAIDPITGDRPAFLQRVDGHSALVNSAALRLAGVDATTHDPQDGVIVRDAEGVPTGVLKEGAVDLVSKLVPAPSHDRKLRAARLALAQAAAAGLTSCVDHGGDVDVYLELLHGGELTCRIQSWANLGSDLDAMKALRARLEPVKAMIEMRTLKGFVDGTFGSRTAAMVQPFHDDASTSGVLNIQPEVLIEQVVAADAAGFQVALHAIGDRAVSIALDAFAAAAARNGTAGRRHRVEHAQVMQRSDVARMAALGVTASIQPCHLLTDRRFAVDRLGEERAKDSYLWRSLADAGVHLAFGSDFFVEPLDPWRNLFAAVTRASETDPTDPPYFPAECLTLAEALAGQTTGGAYACHREGELGALVPGSLADLVILDAPLDEKNPRALLDRRPWRTVMGGRVVYRAP